MSQDLFVPEAYGTIPSLLDAGLASTIQHRPVRDPHASEWQLHGFASPRVFYGARHRFLDPHLQSGARFGPSCTPGFFVQAGCVPARECKRMAKGRSFSRGVSGAGRSPGKPPRRISGYQPRARRHGRRRSRTIRRSVSWTKSPRISEDDPEAPDAKGSGGQGPSPPRFRLTNPMTAAGIRTPRAHAGARPLPGDGCGPRPGRIAALWVRWPCSQNHSRLRTFHTSSHGHIRDHSSVTKG
jgi:hypothetical protein